ncbi:MAG: DUF438 domain-containing protein [candidate division Zixibacteria bacterium]|nr:DUF438 domain-containing protein [candidate division Zixibacteria bacterium]
MSELINDARKRKDLLKHMILQLHKGEAPDAVRTQLVRLMGEVPYGDVVEVEQELIGEGLPEKEILNLCDMHTAVLKGSIDQTGAKTAPSGHPVHTFKEENKALGWEVGSLVKLYDELKALPEKTPVAERVAEIKKHFNALMDVDKHYQRKENLLFPFLEKHGITGPPTVMWGKHDETRGLLKAAQEALKESALLSAGDFKMVIDLVLHPASNAVEEMIYKEEQILFPMCLDTLTDEEWYSIYNQSLEIGFCLYDPVEKWAPAELSAEAQLSADARRVQLPSGSFTVPELNAVLNTIPFDLTFVDKDDQVRYFTQGKERIFSRNRAILGRQVQMCHPPSSVHVVQNILDDFKSGNQDRAAFHIEMQGKFISIEYFALRGEKGEYLGTLEVSQDLTEKRKLKGEKRLLSYSEERSR